MMTIVELYVQLYTLTQNTQVTQGKHFVQKYRTESSYNSVIKSQSTPSPPFSPCFYNLFSSGAVIQAGDFLLLFSSHFQKFKTPCVPRAFSPFEKSFLPLSFHSLLFPFFLYYFSPSPFSFSLSPAVASLMSSLACFDNISFAFIMHATFTTSWLKVELEIAKFLTLFYTHFFVISAESTC